MKTRSMLCMQCGKNRISGGGSFAELAEREGWKLVGGAYICPECQELEKPKRKGFLNRDETGEEETA